MQIESIVLIGCRDLEQASWLGLSPSVATVLGPSPQSSALRDTVHLLFASFSNKALTKLLKQWRWGEEIEVLGEDLPEQAIFQSGERAAFLLKDEQPRRIQVDMTLALDAAQLGRLRDALTREPQLLQALLLSPKISFRWSALFNRGLTAVAFHLSTIKLGDHALEIGPHPTWLKGLFSDFSHRFSTALPTAAVAELAADAAVSLTNLPAYRSFIEALSGLGAVRAARDSEKVAMILLDERPLSQWGVHRQIEQAALLHLSGAEIVWIDGPLLIDADPDVQILHSTSNGASVLSDASGPAALPFRRDGSA